MDRRVNSCRLGALLGLATALAAMPALAGDRAALDIIGYSEDGRYFAFEEYGYQDGSGLAFSSIFLVDLDADQWVQGSPFRIIDEQEDVDAPSSLLQIRGQAARAAAAGLETLAIEYPAEIAALNGDGALGNDGKTLRFGLPAYGLSEPEGDYTLLLRTFPSTSPEPCEDYMGAPPLGFALTIAGAEAERELHRDASLPSSRGCPWDYRIFAAVTPSWGSGLDHAVAIISVYPHGFEGPDRRFIAVPIAD